VLRLPRRGCPIVWGVCLWRFSFLHFRLRIASVLTGAGRRLWTVGGKQENMLFVHVAITIRIYELIKEKRKHTLRGGVVLSTGERATLRLSGFTHLGTGLLASRCWSNTSGLTVFVCASSEPELDLIFLGLKHSGVCRIFGDGAHATRPLALD